MNEKPNAFNRGATADALKNNLVDLQAGIYKLSFNLNNAIDILKEHCLKLKNEVQLVTETTIEQVNKRTRP